MTSKNLIAVLLDNPELAEELTRVGSLVVRKHSHYDCRYWECIDCSSPSYLDDIQEQLRTVMKKIFLKMEDLEKDKVDVKVEEEKVNVKGGNRVLPYFAEDESDPTARGFSTKSFSEGLSASEMFFIQAGSREALTDCAIRRNGNHIGN